jgi:ribonuclease Z
MGVPDGPVRKELAQGRPVALDDRTIIDPENVLGPPERKKLVVIGDIETTEGLADRIRGADTLLIEATFLERDADTARDYGHLTAAEAAALATASGVKELVLTHISGRDADDDLRVEAASTFPNCRIAADFDRIVI